MRLLLWVHTGPTRDKGVNNSLVRQKVSYIGYLYHSVTHVEYGMLESGIKGGVCFSSSSFPHLEKVFIPHKIGRYPVHRHTDGR